MYGYPTALSTPWVETFALALLLSPLQSASIGISFSHDPMPASAPAADIHVGGLACRGKFSHPRSGGVRCVRSTCVGWAAQHQTHIYPGRHRGAGPSTTQSDKTLAEAMPRPASLCAVLAVRNEDVRAGVLTPQIRPLSKYHETVASGVEEIGHGSFVHELGWERVSRPREQVDGSHHGSPPLSTAPPSCTACSPA